ncbi:ribosome biogenesis GTP-binding protein YihA/YsxC [Sphingomonas sp. MA1305]|uniref:ribosome biogenesis GTP-binding protein YihA/YsxC n=1 Tax=Sphingomonas sp. MA1305 TaxID=2479204 RepID=UPI002FCD3F40
MSEDGTPLDEGFTPELIEAARRTFAGPVAFLKSAPSLKFLPDPDVPEVAFAGRSNVGKSSLLNALTGRNALARTSNTPGRTQELNFFDVAGNGEAPAFRLVDMPGYGFAKAPKDVVRTWRYLVNDYLRGRDVLKRVLVLIDSRHGIKDVDREILGMLDKAAVSYRLILTKADKVKATDLADVMARTAEDARKRPAAHPDILATSSEGGLGIPELRAAVLEAIG